MIAIAGNISNHRAYTAGVMLAPRFIQAFKFGWFLSALLSILILINIGPLLNYAASKSLFHKNLQASPQEPYLLKPLRAR